MCDRNRKKYLFLQSPMNDIIMVPNLVQDSIKSADTLKAIKASKLFPAKIESSDGAIIPKQAVQWTELQPSFPSKKETSDFNQNYIWLALGVLLIVGIGIYLFKKRHKKNA